MCELVQALALQGRTSRAGLMGRLGNQTSLFKLLYTKAFWGYSKLWRPLLGSTQWSLAWLWGSSVRNLRFNVDGKDLRWVWLVCCSAECHVRSVIWKLPRPDLRLQNGILSRWFVDHVTWVSVNYYKSFAKIKRQALTANSPMHTFSSNGLLLSVTSTMPHSTLLIYDSTLHVCLTLIIELIFP